MSFFAELKRRNVFRVGIAYIVAAWLLLQLTEVLTELLDLPDVAGRFVVLILIIGFIPAVIFAWAFEMTPEGLKRESEVDRSRSITKHTGRKLDRTIIAMLAVVAAYFLWEARFKDASEPGAALEQSGEQSAQAPTAPAANENAIAVLPFANRSLQQEDLFFTDGIHDDLLTQLAKIKGLKVISRTSVMEYRDTTKKIPEIAAELGVDKILEGGVQRAGDRVRINAQLIDVAHDQHLWAETFDREMTVENIFDIQSEITRQIITAVKGELTSDEQRALVEQPTDNLEAYEAYLRARAATNLADYGRDKYQEAEPWALRAVELDPGFAKAWALVAEIHAQAIWIGWDNSAERRGRSRDALARAVALDPGDPTVIAAQADHFYRLDNDYPVAYELYQKAQAAAPGDARIVLFTAITERRLGLWEESIATFERAHEMDPANSFTANQLVDTLLRMRAWGRADPLLSEWLIRYPESRDMPVARVYLLMHQGRLQEARDLFDRIPLNTSNNYASFGNQLLRWSRDFPALIAFHDRLQAAGYVSATTDSRELNQAIANHFNGNPAAAERLFREHLEKMLDLKTHDARSESFRLLTLAIAQAYLGEMDQALALAQEALETLPPEKDHLFGSAIHRAQTLVIGMAGRHDEAIDRIAADLDATEGFTRWELQLDPQWDFLRGNQRFDALVAPVQVSEGET